jgi:hypothetical protein
VIWAVRSSGVKAQTEAQNRHEAEAKFAKWARDNGHTIGFVSVVPAERLDPDQREGLEVIS